MIEMASLARQYTYWYEDIMVNKSDPRVKDMPFMESPRTTLIITVLYLAMVAYGPGIMKDRKSFNLNGIMKIYNLTTCLTSGYLVHEYLMSGWLFDYSFGCQPVDYSQNPKALRMVNTCWLFFFTKIVDLLDTVFFVLRKKNNQLSFLHVMHHGIMPISCWVALKFVPGGFGTFSCLLNSGIHFIMYFYYFLSSFGDTFRPYLGWKKYLTAMQMIQFLMIMVHSSQLLFIKCDFPIGWCYWGCSYLVVFLIFFGNFYIKSYSKKSKDSKKLLKKEK
jgi:elongation of very long chain fatty acids protein 7